MYVGSRTDLLTLIRKPKCWLINISVSHASNRSTVVTFRSISSRYLMILTLSYYKRKEFLIILRKYAELRKARNKCRKTRKADPSTVSRKQSTPSFSKMEHLLPPDTHTNMYISGGKKCSFFGKFGVLCFLEIPGLRFAFLPYY